MRNWGYWDWIGYVVLGVAAIVEAFNTSLKAAPDLTAALPAFLSGTVIGYAPLAFFSLATVVLLGRAFGLLPGKADDSPGKAQTLQVQLGGRAGHWLKEGNVYAGNLGDQGPAPRAVASFARKGQKAEVCIDFSYYQGGIGVVGKWRDRTRVFIRDLPSFRRDERVIVPIMWMDGQCWGWGDGNRGLANPEGQRNLKTERQYRGRVAFLFEDDSEEYIYFIARTGKNPADMPDVIGQHMFLFSKEWEAD